MRASLKSLGRFSLLATLAFGALNAVPAFAQTPTDETGSRIDAKDDSRVNGRVDAPAPTQANTPKTGSDSDKDSDKTQLAPDHSAGSDQSAAKMQSHSAGYEGAQAMNRHTVTGSAKPQTVFKPGVGWIKASAADTCDARSTACPASAGNAGSSLQASRSPASSPQTGGQSSQPAGTGVSGHLSGAAGDAQSLHKLAKHTSRENSSDTTKQSKTEASGAGGEELANSSDSSQSSPLGSSQGVTTSALRPSLQPVMMKPKKPEIGEHVELGFPSQGDEEDDNTVRKPHKKKPGSLIQLGTSAKASGLSKTSAKGKTSTDANHHSKQSLNGPQ